MEDGELSGEGQELLQRGEEVEGGIAQAQAAWPVTEPSDARIVGVLDCQLQKILCRESLAKSLASRWPKCHLRLILQLASRAGDGCLSPKLQPSTLNPKPRGILMLGLRRYIGSRI